MRAPSFKRVLALAEKLVTLIDRGDPRDCPRLVVEDFIGNVRSNPQPGHSRYASSAQIVKMPPGDLGKFVKLTFGSREVLKRSTLMDSKHVRTLLRHPLQDGDRLVRKLHDMRLGIFRS